MLKKFTLSSFLFSGKDAFLWIKYDISSGNKTKFEVLGLKSQQKSQRHIYGMSPKKIGEASWVKIRVLLPEHKWIDLT